MPLKAVAIITSTAATTLGLSNNTSIINTDLQLVTIK